MHEPENVVHVNGKIAAIPKNVRSLRFSYRGTPYTHTI